MVIKKFFFFLIVLLIIPLAIATTVNTDKEVYNLNEQVTVGGTCAGPNLAVGLQATLAGNSVWLTQAAANAQNAYSKSFIPLQNGTYTVTASCNGEFGASTQFCVGPDGCQAAGQGGVPAAAPPGNQGGTGGGGTGSGTTWVCAQQWSYCNSTSQQGRECYKKKSPAIIKLEVQPCEQCDQYWVCDDWSQCNNGQQTRSCHDEHKCGLTSNKPFLSKLCNQPDTGYQPAKVTPRPYVPPPTPKPAQIQQPKSSFWDDYGMYVIVALSVLALAGLTTGLVLHFRHPSNVKYNIKELEDWITKERATGTPDTHIREILQDHTKWSHDDISEAFKDLGGHPEEKSVESIKPEQSPENKAS